jgi:hypothetical protein
MLECPKCGSRRDDPGDRPGSAPFNALCQDCRRAARAPARARSDETQDEADFGDVTGVLLSGALDLVAQVRTPVAPERSRVAPQASRADDATLVDAPVVDATLVDAPLGDATLADHAWGDAPWADALVTDAPSDEAPTTDATSQPPWADASVAYAPTDDAATTGTRATGAPTTDAAPSRPWADPSGEVDLEPFPPRPDDGWSPEVTTTLLAADAPAVPDDRRITRVLGEHELLRVRVASGASLPAPSPASPPVDRPQFDSAAADPSPPRVAPLAAAPSRAPKPAAPSRQPEVGRRAASRPRRRALPRWGWAAFGALALAVGGAAGWMASSPRPTVRKPNVARSGPPGTTARPVPARSKARGPR